MGKKKLIKRLMALTLTVCLTASSVPMGAGGQVEAAPDNWEEISSIISNYYGEWNNNSYSGQTSSHLPDTAILGNGDIGVVSGGNTDEKTFYISKGDFWSANKMNGPIGSSVNIITAGGITLKSADAESKIDVTNAQIKACEADTWSSPTPDKMLDGDITTKWCTTTKHEENVPHWAIIDLGSVQKIAAYKMYNANTQANESVARNTKDFTLEYLPNTTEIDWETVESEEGWTSIDDVKENNEDIYQKNLNQTIETRYLRLLIHKASGEPGKEQTVRIQELEFYSEPFKNNGSSEFYEKQNILDAQVETECSLGSIPLQMKTWTSATENVIVTELTSSASETVALQLDTWAKNEWKDKYPIEASVDENASIATAQRSTWNGAADRSDSWTSKVAISSKIVGTESTMTANSELGKVETVFEVDAGETVYIVTAVGGGGRTYNYRGELQNEKEPMDEATAILDTITDSQDILDMYTEHLSWWKNYWSASYIDLQDDPKLNKIEKYYYGAQYMLGSTVREGKLAPGLYGVWVTTTQPKFNGDYHLNYNFISTFYGAASSNRSDYLMPAVQTMLDMMPRGQYNAEHTNIVSKVNQDFVNKKIESGEIDPVNGIQGGILYDIAVAPWGYGVHTQDSPSFGFMGEVMGAPYSAYPMIQYYEYTQDAEYLENVLYPFVKKCLTFLEAWLVKEQDGDSYKYTHYAAYNEFSWAENPAIEIAAYKNILETGIEASEILGVDAERREKWVDIYTHMAKQPVSEWSGRRVYSLAEKVWNGTEFVELANPVPADGNILPLDSIMPGEQIGYYSSPEELEIARNTVDVFGDRAWYQINNFPRIFTDAIKCRYPAETIVDKMVQVIDRQMRPNLRISDGTHGVEKIGATEAINSMMLQTDKDITKIFPNWYADKSAKFANLCAKGAFTISAEYDGTAQEAKNVTITSEAGKDMTLVSPWKEGMTVKDSDGNVVVTTKGTVPNWEDVENATYTFATTAGETYTVEKGETTQEQSSKKTLEKILNQAKEHKANGDVDSCVDSIKKLFVEAIAEGEAVMANENATREEITNASLKLLKAIHALEMKAADKTDLEMTLELAREIAAELDKYVEAGKTEFNEALANGETVYANGDAFQEEVDAAWDALVEALLNLRLKADKSILEELINEVKTIDLSLYTEESVAVFKKALAAAEDVKADDTLSEDDQKIVDDAVKTLADAKDQLQLKNGSAGDNNGDNNGNGNKLNEGNKPSNDKGPKTGDTTSLFIWMAVAIAAVGTAVTFVGMRGRKNRRNKR